MDHFDETIECLRLRIEKLQNAIATLHELRAAARASNAVSPATKNGGFKPGALRESPSRAMAPKKRVAKPPALEDVIRGMKQPFRSADVAKAAQVSKKTAANVLNRMKRNGLLKSRTWGEFERSEKFPDPNSSERLLAQIHTELAEAKRSTGNNEDAR